MSYRFPTQPEFAVPESVKDRHDFLMGLHDDMCGVFEKVALADTLIAQALAIYSHDPSDGHAAGLTIAVLAKAMDSSDSAKRADTVLNIIENMYQDHRMTALVRDRYGKALNYMIDDYPDKIESSIAKLEELYDIDPNLDTKIWLASGLSSGLPKLEEANSREAARLRDLYNEVKSCLGG